MKKLLLASVAISALSLGSVLAHAADVVEAQPFDWSGFYFGLHAGYAWGTADTHLDLGGASGNNDMQGFVGGGLLGWNFQMSSIVLGAEADIGFSDIQGSGHIDGAEGFSPKIKDVQLQPNGHVRLRLGVPIDRVMPFIAGGLALADSDLHIDASPAFDDRDSKFLTGFSIGGGVDFALTDSVLLRAEYLYDDYGKNSYNVGPSNADLNVNTNTVRGALIWRFN